MSSTPPVLDGECDDEKKVQILRQCILQKKSIPVEIWQVSDLASYEVFHKHLLALFSHSDFIRDYQEYFSYRLKRHYCKGEFIFLSTIFQFLCLDQKLLFESLKHFPTLFSSISDIIHTYVDKDSTALLLLVLSLWTCGYQFVIEGDTQSLKDTNYFEHVLRSLSSLFISHQFEDLETLYLFVPVVSKILMLCAWVSHHDQQSFFEGSKPHIFSILCLYESILNCTEKEVTNFLGAKLLSPKNRNLYDSWVIPSCLKLRFPTLNSQKTITEHYEMMLFTPWAFYFVYMHEQTLNFAKTHSLFPLIARIVNRSLICFFRYCLSTPYQPSDILQISLDRIWSIQCKIALLCHSIRSSFTQLNETEPFKNLTLQILDNIGKYEKRISHHIFPTLEQFLQTFHFQLLYPQSGCTFIMSSLAKCDWDMKTVQNVQEAFQASKSPITRKKLLLELKHPGPFRALALRSKKRGELFDYLAYTHATILRLPMMDFYSELQHTLTMVHRYALLSFRNKEYSSALEYWKSLLCYGYPPEDVHTVHEHIVDCLYHLKNFEKAYKLSREYQCSPSLQLKILFELVKHHSDLIQDFQLLFSQHRCSLQKSIRKQYDVYLDSLNRSQTQSEKVLQQQKQQKQQQQQKQQKQQQKQTSSASDDHSQEDVKENTSDVHRQSLIEAMRVQRIKEQQERSQHNNPNNPFPEHISFQKHQCSYCQQLLDEQSFVLLKCSRKCCFYFHHPLCYKEIKSNTINSCLTPNCNGNIVSAILFRDGQPKRHLAILSMPCSTTLLSTTTNSNTTSLASNSPSSSFDLSSSSSSSDLSSSSLSLSSSQCSSSSSSSCFSSSSSSWLNPFSLSQESNCSYTDFAASDQVLQVLQISQNSEVSQDNNEIAPADLLNVIPLTLESSDEWMKVSPKIERKKKKKQDKDEKSSKTNKYQKIDPEQLNALVISEKNDSSHCIMVTKHYFSISPSRTIFIGPLKKEITTEVVQAWFDSYGPVHVQLVSFNTKQLGATITYNTIFEAMCAFTLEKKRSKVYLSQGKAQICFPDMHYMNSNFLS